MTDIEEGTSKKAELYHVKFLSPYEGETRDDKLDSFIRAHPVTMITKSYCLFSCE